MEELNLGTVSMTCTPEGETAVVTLGGELDISSVDAVRTRLLDTLPPGVRRVVFELSALEFMDSSGIAFMLSVREHAGDVELHRPSPMVARIVEATGLADVLRIVP